ncbi:hypothetical protein AJ80_08654 [Polytolypa hystricis UAMH7299]|uniref:SGNH hydrolase-type esterase domain-containing protein n=1 Tax=Polytolypa hystricis (strain UAMH7299) TaxID=1447883 RepID=A0A2B7X4C9_POLH7|nr:hypothetical protein AJ80_08654 [Polytolypa hystricis UAMH7299]
MFLLTPFCEVFIICIAFFALTCFSVPTSSKPPAARSQNAIANGVPLRILPLGDSITFGTGSTDGTGYRLHLLNHLTRFNPVHYIGSVQSGNMTNAANEGHPGLPIGPVGHEGVKNYIHRPNVILLMAGTNDIVFNLNPAGAPRVLGRVVDEIVEGCPGAAVLVGSLTPLRKAEREEMRVAFNVALRDVVIAEREGKHVALVDMERVKMEHIAKDGIHPTDEGYELMAQAWYEAIVEAGERGWISEPYMYTRRPGNVIIKYGELGKRWRSAHLTGAMAAAMGCFVVVWKFVLVRRREGDGLRI